MQVEQEPCQEVNPLTGMCVIIDDQDLGFDPDGLLENYLTSLTDQVEQQQQAAAAQQTPPQPLQEEGGLERAPEAPAPRRRPRKQGKRQLARVPVIL